MKKRASFIILLAVLIVIALTITIYITSNSKVYLSGGLGDGSRSFPSNEAQFGNWCDNHANYFLVGDDCYFMEAGHIYKCNRFKGECIILY